MRYAAQVIVIAYKIAHTRGSEIGDTGQMIVGAVERESAEIAHAIQVECGELIRIYGQTIEVRTAEERSEVIDPAIQNTEMCIGQRTDIIPPHIEYPGGAQVAIAK